MTSAATVIVIAGLPCTGKSAVASAIQARLGWPLFAKDQYKERLFDTLGVGDRAWSRKLSNAAFELLFVSLEQMLAHGHSCIVEANFRAEHINRLQDLKAMAHARIVQVHCYVQAQDVLAARFLERARSGSRHPGHVDLESWPDLAPTLSAGRTQPLALPGPIIEFDATAIDDASIAAAAMLVCTHIQ